MLKAVVFDFDGTLVDSIPGIWSQYQRVIEELGLEKISHRDFTRQIGRTWDEILKNFWPKLDPKEFTRHYRVDEEDFKAFNGVNDTLSILKDRYDLAIMSARGGSTLFEHLKKSKIDESFFRIILYREKLEYNKPDPRALIRVCEELGYPNKDVVYVGDSVIDALCAKEAGVDFVAVLSGGAYEVDFREAGVDKIISDVTSLPQLLDDLRQLQNSGVGPESGT